MPRNGVTGQLAAGGAAGGGAAAGGAVGGEAEAAGGAGAAAEDRTPVEGGVAVAAAVR